mmetsp:Transcript_20417/g.61224  ORF Transcript_20417/g.61224 Transcript_20417/m.61224 type:complete len:237 (-) Transcript_20417:270-980(-)
MKVASHFLWHCAPSDSASRQKAHLSGWSGVSSSPPAKTRCTLSSTPFLCASSARSALSSPPLLQSRCTLRSTRSTSIRVGSGIANPPLALQLPLLLLLLLALLLPPPPPPSAAPVGVPSAMMARAAGCGIPRGSPAPAAPPEAPALHPLTPAHHVYFARVREAEAAAAAEAAASDAYAAAAAASVSPSEPSSRRRGFASCIVPCLLGVLLGVCLTLSASLLLPRSSWPPAWTMDGT